MFAARWSLSPGGAIARPHIDRVKTVSAVVVSLMVTGALACGGDSAAPGTGTGGQAGSGVTGPDAGAAATPGATAGTGGTVTEPPGGGGATVGAKCQITGAEAAITSTAGDSIAPQVRVAGDGYVVTFADNRSPGAGIYAATLNAQGQKAAPELLIAPAAVTADHPAVSPGAGGGPLLWDNQDAARVSTVNGQPWNASTAGVPVVVGVTDLNSGRPAVLANATGGLGAWMKAIAPGAPMDETKATILVAPLTPTGAPAGAPTPLAGGAATRYPTFATNGAAAVLTYVQTGGAGVQVKLAFIDAATGAVANDIAVRDLAAGASNPNVAWDGSKWVVAWEDLRNGSEESIFYTRVGPDGVVEPERALAGTSDSSANWPQIAAGAGGTAVAQYAFVADAEIVVSFLGLDGNKLGNDLRVSNSSGQAKFPSIAYNAVTDEYGVAWSDTRTKDREIFFARVRCAP